MDKVWDPTHLSLGAWQVIRNDGAAGVDHRSCEQLEKELPGEVDLLARRLREGTYQPQAVMESGRRWQPTTQGAPQGAVLSP